MRNREQFIRLFICKSIDTIVGVRSWVFQLGVLGASGVFDVGVVGGRLIM